MGVTHVVRGEEWISSTPKHLYLYDCFGWDRPSYVHLPTVLGQDHKKLSKRNGDVSVELFIQRGYLKEALINYIALLGWSPKGNEEKLSLEELEAQFDFDRVANTGGIFDEKKLMWLNQQYIQALSAEECSVYLRTFLEKEGCIDASYPQEKLLLLAETYGNRIERFDQVPAMLAHFFTPAVELKYTEKAQEALKDQQGAMLVRRFSQSLDEEGFSSEWAHTIVSRIQKETGIKGKNLWFPIRAAVVGDTSGPDFGNTLCVLGEGEIRARLERVEQEFLREE